MIHQKVIKTKTPGRGLHEITREIEKVVSESGIHTGLCVIFCKHTSASLVIQENADPTARQDLEKWLERIAPDGDPRYSHDMEGPDDMPSHLRASVTKTSETIPIVAGRLCLGTWQGVYLAEHRTDPHSRECLVHCQGENK